MAKKIVNIKTLSHEEWLELRRKGIGGSDAACCVGMNPYKSLIALYADKKGMSSEVEDNERMRLGRDLEQYVAERFEEATDKKVRNDNFMYAHDDYEFLIADIDRRVVGENAVLECKTMQQSYAKEFDISHGLVPENYYCQCQHYMNVTGADTSYLAVLVFGDGFYWCEIKRNDEFIKQLQDAEIEFWNENILKDESPAPDGSSSSTDALKDMFTDREDGVVTNIPDFDEMIAQHRFLKGQIKEMEEDAKEIENKIKLALGNKEFAEGQRYKVSYKFSKRRSVNTDLLKSSGLYEQYSSESVQRRFTTSEIK